MRTGWGKEAHHLIFDCGEIAAGVMENEVPSSAHGHSDALSIQVSAYGTPFLVDSGFYTYNGPIDWHRYFRDTSAHNTVVVDGESQSEFRGRLKWSHAPRTKLNFWMTSIPFDFVEGSHDGYRRLAQPGVHRRAVIFLKPDYWLVRDELTGKGAHEIDRYFHFSPMDVYRNTGTKTVRTQRIDGKTFSILSVEDEGIELDIIESGENPACGWIATGYEKKIRAPIVRYRYKGKLPFESHVLLLPTPAEEYRIPNRSAQIFRDPGTPGENSFMVAFHSRKDIFLISSLSGVDPTFQGWRSDGRVATIRMNEKGDVTAFLLIDGSRIAQEGRVIIELGRKVGFASFSLVEDKAMLEISEPAHVSTFFPDPPLVVSPSWNRG